MPVDIDRLVDHVDRRREDIVGTLCDLVRINTVNPYSGSSTIGSEKPGQLYLQQRLTSLGAATALWPLPDDVYARAGIIGPKGRDFTDRPNLVATFDFGGAGPHVLVFGHMDTVSADEMTIEPFGAERRDGCVYGRGTSDDKGGLAVALHAAEALLASGPALCGKLTVASVVEEECDGSGAGIMAVLLGGCRPDAAICMDGYAGFIARGGSGVLTGRARVPGVAAHAAHGTGVSALEKALVVKSALDAVKARREVARPEGYLNIGVLRAGSHPAMVPGEAELGFNVVTHLDEAEASRRAGHGFCASLLRHEIEQALDDAASGDAFLCDHRPHLTWVKDLPPYDTPADAPLLRDLCAAWQAVTGEAAPVDTMNGWSDACHVPLLTGCDVVNLGVGAPGAAHAADEYVEESVLVRNTKILAAYLAAKLAAE